MRLTRLLAPMSALAVSTACSLSQVPIEVSAPRPAEVVLRVKRLGACSTASTCDPSSAAVTSRGILVFADGDSLVMTDMGAGERVAIRPDSTVQLEVYRGQRRTVKGAVKATGKGYL